MARSADAVRTRRHYLMCPPTYFAVEYAINPWMDPGVGVDRARAVRQWETLRELYTSLGHRVSEITPIDGLPDMVFAANGALVVDGRVYGARFASAERTPEGPAYLEWFRQAGFAETREPKHVNEGEGDFITLDTVVLAATGFRTEAAAHQEAELFLGRPVITLQLVDPRFYHLDTALFALSGDQVAYYPGAFSAGSRRVLASLFPDALLATEEDAAVLGLNAVCDGTDVVIAAEATALAARLRDLGYRVHPVELDELRKAGGGAKCCTLEIRDARD
ncbi:N-dimethylarginine dimethylaminohydrolase [Nocardiopsis sp. Huas11]|uniref:dimethylargininase n=1 Tax=Nocardiopsis sp. Huas11 TaxID=2183912 RepID=UPI000EAC76A3|nr:dimethylargininase [Nocardiopsis sp. Huas11]RKS08965.1 N-dimethylarginine dimethylaminohydrolase [Nocardiopsis sp. Huas11]